jgi:hypothetical protein
MSLKAMVTFDNAVKRTLHYCPDTGKVLWKEKYSKYSSCSIGTECGGVDSHGYRRVTLAGKTVFVHHVVWFLNYNEWPTQLDHINRNTLDNRIENLRKATKQQNAANSGKRQTTSSKYKGVTLHKQTNKWQVSIGTPRKHIGLFMTEQEAAYAYAKAANHLYGEYAYTNYNSHDD